MKLFGSLFGRGRAAEAEPARVPPNRRVYAIGDIHGCAHLLDDLYAMILADAEQYPGKQIVIVHLGDYVDRGPDSRGVLDRLTAPPPAGVERVILRGNHESMTEAFLEDAGNGAAWFAAGGMETLLSYGVAVAKLPRSDAEYEVLRAEFERVVPPAHRALMQSSPVTHREGHYYFVHAGVRPGVPLLQQVEDDQLWIRGEFLNSRADHGAVIVHGHSVSFGVESLGNRIGIDTGAYATGTLTALVLDGGRRFMLQTK
jgi:serine/threonine protein phosphatase 1